MTGHVNNSLRAALFFENKSTDHGKSTEKSELLYVMKCTITLHVIIFLENSRQICENTVLVLTIYAGLFVLELSEH